MCYKQPGPRCSASARDERIKWLSQYTDAKAAVSRTHSTLQEWRAAHPGDPDPVDLETQRAEAVEHARFTRQMLAEATTEYEQTPEALLRMSAAIASKAGLTDDGHSGEYRASGSALAQAEAQVLRFQKEHPDTKKVPAALAEARKFAREQHNDATRRALAPLMDQVALQINQNPTRYGFSERYGVDGDRINLTSIPHVQALLDTVKRLRRDGTLQQAEEVTQLAHRLASGASNRAARIALLGGEMDADPMDSHRQPNPDREAYVRRICNPDTRVILIEDRQQRSAPLDEHSHDWASEDDTVTVA